MKRLIAALLLLALCLGLMNGCKNAETEDADIDLFVEDQGAADNTNNNTNNNINNNSNNNNNGNVNDSSNQGTPQVPDNDGGNTQAPPKDEPADQQKPAEKPNEEQEDQKEDPKEEQQTPPAEEGQTPPAEQEKPNEVPDNGEQGGGEEVVTPSPEEALSNLYQSSVLNTAIGYDGKNTKNSKYTVSKGIEVKAGDRVTFGPMASAQVVMGYAYDGANKPLQIINAHTVKEVATFMGGKKVYTYSIPAGAESVKFSVHNNSKNEFVVVRNNEFDLAEYSQLSGMVADFVDDPLKDMDGLFVGDSICIATRDEKMSGVKGWARRIADEYGMNAVNNGKSGVSVSNKRSQGTVLTQLLEKKTQNFDYVVLHGGVNDAWSLVDVGVMEDGFDPTEFDPATFGGGLELLIYNAILYYGDTASIGYLINFKAPACEKGTVKDMTAYNELAKKICDKWGITYFDMYNHEQLTKELKMDTLTHTTDYIHPSSSGYDIISPYIAEYMKTMVPVKQEVLVQILAK